MFVRYSPWQDFNALQREIDRVFEDLQAATLVKDPVVEMHDTEDAVHVKLELTGVGVKDLDVEATEDSVKVVASRKADNNDKIRSEFYGGKFERVISLPARIVNTKVKAEYKNGVLNLTLPKIKQEKNKVVKVNIEEVAV